jgi:hypothetical protein
MIMGRFSGVLRYVGLFALGVTIGLGYVYISRPHQAELPESATMARVTEATRDVAISPGNDAALPDGVEGPASIAFADPAAPAH